MVFVRFGGVQQLASFLGTHLPRRPLVLRVHWRSSARRRFAPTLRRWLPLRLTLALRRRLPLRLTLPLRRWLPLRLTLALRRRLPLRLTLPLRRWLPLRLTLPLRRRLPLTAATTLTATSPAPAALLRRLPKRIDPPLNKVAIEFAVSVVAPQLQRRLIRLDRIGPFLDGLLRR